MEKSSMERKDIERKLSRNPLIREVFDLSPEAYLVGGYIRDVIAGRKRPLDVDFVLRTKVQAVAEELARRHHGTVVVLGDEGLIRVVLKDKRTIDLSRISDSIENDLKRRDFTMNSVAWSPASGLVNSCNGLFDIKQGFIRLYLNRNIHHDPLRILRAYRFVSQLGWKIEKETRSFIKAQAHLLNNVATERITLELFKLLDGKYHGQALRAAANDGVLNIIIPNNISTLRRNVNEIARDNLIADANSNRKTTQTGFQGLSRAGVVRLLRLLLGLRADRCRLTLSTRLSKKIETVNELYKEFKTLKAQDDMEMFRCFELASDASEDLLILTDHMELSSDLKRFRRTQEHPLVGAIEIMKVLGLEEGVAVGKILRDIKMKTFNRTLKRKDQAIKYLMLNYK